MKTEAPPRRQRHPARQAKLEAEALALADLRREHGSAFEPAQSDAYQLWCESWEEESVSGHDAEAGAEALPQSGSARSFGARQPRRGRGLATSRESSVDRQATLSTRVPALTHRLREKPFRSVAAMLLVLLFIRGVYASGREILDWMYETWLCKPVPSGAHFIVVDFATAGLDLTTIQVDLVRSGLKNEAVVEETVKIRSVIKPPATVSAVVELALLHLPGLYSLQPRNLDSTWKGKALPVARINNSGDLQVCVSPPALAASPPAVGDQAAQPTPSSTPNSAGPAPVTLAAPATDKLALEPHLNSASEHVPMPIFAIHLSIPDHDQCFDVSSSFQRIQFQFAAPEFRASTPTTVSLLRLSGDPTVTFEDATTSSTRIGVEWGDMVVVGSSASSTGGSASLTVEHSLVSPSKYMFLIDNDSAFFPLLVTTNAGGSHLCFSDVKFGKPNLPRRDLQTRQPGMNCNTYPNGTKLFMGLDPRFDPAQVHVDLVRTGGKDEMSFPLKIEGRMGSPTDIAIDPSLLYSGEYYFRYVFLDRGSLEQRIPLVVTKTDESITFCIGGTHSEERVPSTPAS